MLSLRRSLYFVVSLLVGAGVGAAVTDESQFRNAFTEEERLSGFAEHVKQARDFDRQREAGAAQVKKNRQAWDQMLLKTLPSFKKEHAREAAPLDETSSAYRQSLKERIQDSDRLEASEKAYIRARNKALSRQKSRIHLTEEQEYGLVPDPVRVAFRNRPLYTGKAKPSSTSGSSNSSGAGSYEAPPPNIPSLPPPPSNPTDFYEPEFPPPPPPLDGSFDDSIPPPIFDEPEF